MLRIFAILLLFGSLSANAAVNAAPIAADDGFIQDDERIQDSSESEEYILSAADEEFLNSDDEDAIHSGIQLPEGKKEAKSSLDSEKNQKK